ncbi:hypothetical protein BU23DRAFT_626576 [Bimuria novae-zelandiae CBS 107.79]|uniref:Mediator of RNA polymerase II transcription subunit 13 n=1 Tax=Bimuria novae-zelandiae CBS 107.79 TaxID=1447943 RepID=A0A6A5VH73_9PLEO|nr:hypothetical protein BU23DRAFT_626576 [Bimuria novae-zelandiae CBS 107.79]
MEFLKTCNTNAQAIGDFEAVAFQAFSVARNPARQSSTTLDWNTSDDIRAAEAQLREGNHLVLQDASRPWLWLFWAATAEHVGQPPLDLPTLDDYRFNTEQYGVVKASELEHRTTRNARNTALSASTSSPVTPRPQKGLQTGTSQSQNGSQAGASEPQQHDAVAIYGLFTAAVVALVSFRLVKDYNAVALNYRTFASSSAVQQDSASHQYSRQAPLRLTNVDAIWATTGTLVVSTLSLTRPDVHCLADTSADDEQNRLIGKCIRVAPNGTLAKIMSFADPIDSIANDASQRLQRKRAKVSPLERGIEKWKASVTRWLAWKGYTLASLDKKSAWVRIQFAHPSQSVASSSGFFRPAREVLWPRALCFHFDDVEVEVHPPTALDALLIKESDALSWFETPDSKGFVDPLDLAQEWFLGKAERDKILEAQRKAKKAAEDAARAKEETRNTLPSSPIYARAVAYGELQSVSGVYPTPPDGVLPGTVASCGDTPSVSGLATNIILAPGDKNPAINLSGPQEFNTDDRPHESPTSPDVAMQYEDYNADNHDDLFEEMEEGNFEEGNGVTDADFNFFDDPDGDDIIMHDAPQVEETGKASEVMIEEDNVLAAPEVTVKDEPPDPMAALEFALASASANTEQETQIQATEQASYKKESTASEWVQKQPNLPEPNTQALVLTTKAYTPPLSPRFIEKTLLPSPEEKAPQNLPPSQHRDSVFDPLTFNRKMSLSDAKYKEGRFGFAGEKPKSINKRDETRPKSLRDLPLLAKLRYAMGVASSNRNLINSPSDESDNDDSDATSESLLDSEDEVDDVAPMPFTGSLIIPTKRKLPTESVATPLSATSFADSFDSDFGDLVGLQTDDSALVALEPTAWDWALVDHPPPTERAPSGTRWALPVFAPSFSSVPNTPTSQPDLAINLIDEKPMSGKDSIAIAQMVTHQIVSATLDIFQESSSAFSFDEPTSEAQWHSAVKTIFPRAVDCSVAELAAVQDAFPDMSAQMKGPQRPPPRRPNETATALGHHMVQLNPPYVRVRRADTLWDLLPPAIPFWETLGLGPCSPCKNVVAFGIYPYSEALKPCVASFLDNMQMAFDGCKLGNHARVDTVDEYASGLVPCKITGQASARTICKAMRDTCVQLSKVLATKHAQMRDKDESKIDAFVIYMINPFNRPSAIWELCSAFWALFQSYQQGPQSRPDQVQKPDLVLQIVPISYIASCEAPVILDASIYANLAREVYDRCPPSAPSEDKLPLNIYSAPSLQLEETIPRNIQFKLTADTPQDLMRENSYMHIGYAISLDGTWVTAAWSDTCGKSQTVVSYNLGTRPFTDIAKEIWQTTIEILQVRRVTWRVCIAKAGVMEREELEAWVFLVSCPTVLSLFTTLLTVDSEPHLKFTPPVPPGNASAVGQPSANTPDSTPQAGVSPEQGLTPAATPAVETPADPTSDPDARLVDLTDESWGIILAHRLHNSHSINEYRPALISGLLVKRGTSPAHPAPPSSPDPLPGPIIIGVNILWMGAVNPTRAATSPFPSSSDGISPGGQAQSPGPGQEPRYNSLTWTPTPQARAAAENLMKEVLGQFRGLGTLARLRGVKGSRHGAVPWHVAVALRGVRGLVRTVPN